MPKPVGFAASQIVLVTVMVVLYTVLRHVEIHRFVGQGRSHQQQERLHLFPPVPVGAAVSSCAAMALLAAVVLVVVVVPDIAVVAGFAAPLLAAMGLLPAVVIVVALVFQILVATLFMVVQLREHQMGLLREAAVDLQTYQVPHLRVDSSLALVGLVRVCVDVLRAYWLCLVPQLQMDMEMGEEQAPPPLTPPRM